MQLKQAATDLGMYFVVAVTGLAVNPATGLGKDSGEEAGVQTASSVEELGLVAGARYRWMVEEAEGLATVAVQMVEQIGVVVEVVVGVGWCCRQTGSLLEVTACLCWEGPVMAGEGV